MAVEKGHAGTVRALLEGKANLTANALHVAAEKEKIEVPKHKLDLFDHTFPSGVVQRTSG